VGAIAIGDLIKSTLGPKGMVRSACWFVAMVNVSEAGGFTGCGDCSNCGEL